MSSNSFLLKSTNAEFSQRQKNVFDQLLVLENNRKNLGTQNETLMETDEPPPNRRIPRSTTKHFRGKESIFKQPQDRAPRNFIRSIPDFKKNPHKWTKYSLGDVNEEDISDRGNTSAALSFLKEMETRKSLEEQNPSDNGNPVNPEKIIFTKPKLINSKTNISDEESKPTFRSSKVVMPEYVVGQKPKKERSGKKSHTKPTKGKELKLDHLLENEDD